MRDAEEQRAYEAHLALKQARREARAARSARRRAVERQRQERILQSTYPTIWAAVAPNGVPEDSLMHDLTLRSFNMHDAHAQAGRLPILVLERTIHYARHIALFLENEQHPLVLQNRVHMQNGNMDALDAFMTGPN